MKQRENNKMKLNKLKLKQIIKEELGRVLGEESGAFEVMVVENPAFPEFEGKPAFGPASKAECEGFIAGHKWWRGGPGDDGEDIVLEIVAA